jgi:hypothetical protein
MSGTGHGYRRDCVGATTGVTSDCADLMHRTKSTASGRDQCNSTSGMVESARQTNPDDCLFFRRMSRFASLAMCILEQNETAGGYVPPVSVTGLVFGRSIESHREHALRHGMPIYLSRARRNARETNACRHIIRRHFERRGVGVNLPGACRNFDFIEASIPAFVPCSDLYIRIGRE